MATHRRYRKIKTPSKFDRERIEWVRQILRHRAIVECKTFPVEAHAQVNFDSYVRRFREKAADQLRIDLKAKLLRRAMTRIIEGMPLPCCITLEEPSLPESLDILASNRFGESFRNFHAWSLGMVKNDDQALKQFSYPVWKNLDGTASEQKHFTYSYTDGPFGDPCPLGMAMRELEYFIRDQVKLDPRGKATIALRAPIRARNYSDEGVQVSYYTGSILQQPPPPKRAVYLPFNYGSPMSAYADAMLDG